MKRRTPVITLVVTLGALVLMLSLNDALIPNQTAAPGPSPSSTAQPAGAAASKPATPDAAFVGRDDAGKMDVAIAIKDGQAVGYLCNGRSVEAWLEGTATDGRLALESATGDATIYADFDAKGATGTAVVGDYEFDFEIDPAEPPAGLYRKKDGNTTTGWIVQSDGEQVGIANTNGAKRPAPALDTTAGEDYLVTGETR